MTTLVSPLCSLLACATCRGDSGSQSTMAQDGAIGFMLVLLAFVLGTLLLIMFNFARKQRIAQDAADLT